MENLSHNKQREEETIDNTQTDDFASQSIGRTITERRQRCETRGTDETCPRAQILRISRDESFAL